MIRLMSERGRVSGPVPSRVEGHGPMPMIIEGTTYYSTKEAADRLNLTPATIRDRIRAGAIVARHLEDMNRNVIAEEEVARYAAHVGTKGWAVRKTPGYAPDETRRHYQQTWRQRRRQGQDTPTHADRPDAPAPDGAGDKVDA